MRREVTNAMIPNLGNLKIISTLSRLSQTAWKAISRLIYGKEVPLLVLRVQKKVQQQIKHYRQKGYEGPFEVEVWLKKDAKNEREVDRLKIFLSNLPRVKDVSVKPYENCQEDFVFVLPVERAERREVTKFEPRRSIGSSSPSRNPLAERGNPRRRLGWL